MKEKKLVRKAVVIIVVAILFYGFILIFGDFNSIIDEFYKIDIVYFPILFFLVVVQILSSSMKFHRLLKKSRIFIPFKETLKLYLGGMAMSITPGGGGSIIKSYFLKKQYDKPISSSFPIILIERITELLSILVVMTVLLIWVDLYETKIVLIIGYLFFIILMILISSKKFFSSFKNFSTKIKYLKKFSENIDESQKSLKMLISFPTFFEAVSWSIINKVAQLFVVFFIFMSIGINLDFFLSGQIYYTSSLTGVLTFIPAGIVVTETSMIGLLLKHQIELPLATLSVILVRIITTWLIVILGVISLRFLIKENKNLQ